MSAKASLSKYPGFGLCPYTLPTGTVLETTALGFRRNESDSYLLLKDAAGSDELFLVKGPGLHVL